MASASSQNNPKPGLPPVQPPSGRFIAQLFVVPGAIILVVVVIVIGLSYLGKRERRPELFLQQLDSDNPDIRWRGANDLAQILKRPEPATLRWKADAKFALDLVVRLDQAYQNLLAEEKTIAGEIERSTDKDKEALWGKLRDKRNYISFLSSALGDFHVPVGAPLLCAILQHDISPDLKGNTLQRRKALWSLMNMGENVKGFAKIPAEQRQEVLDTLKDEAKSDTPRGRWARTALWYLDKSALPIDQGVDVVKVDTALIACHRADDRFLRELIAMSFNFWDGDRAEETLLTLSADTGRGTLIRVEENE